MDMHEALAMREVVRRDDGWHEVFLCGSMVATLPPDTDMDAFFTGSERDVLLRLYSNALLYNLPSRQHMEAYPPAVLDAMRGTPGEK